MLTRMAMIAMTASSSINVKPAWLRRRASGLQTPRLSPDVIPGVCKPDALRRNRAAEAQRIGRGAGSMDERTRVKRERYGRRERKSGPDCGCRTAFFGM